MTGLRKSRPGISLVELVVAVALLSVVSLAAIQLLNMTDPDANRQTDPDANRQTDPDANRQTDPDANRQTDPDANRQTDPDANRQSGTVNAVTFDSATPLALNRSDACGMQSYLATISTEAEYEHLKRTMLIRETPGWQSGWIGAKANESNTFAWVTGPAAERRAFWYGTGVDGLPFLTGTGQVGDFAGRTLFEYDPLPHFGGNRKRSLVQPRRNNESFWFTNWAAGKEYWPENPTEYSCDSTGSNAPAGGCQPATSRAGDGVAIYGHKNRNGTWFSVPNETQRCDPAREHSICGYYVEFEEPEAENPVKFAHQVTLDMGRFREFCQSADNATR